MTSPPTYAMGYNPVWFFVDQNGLIAVGALMGTYTDSSKSTPKPVSANPDGSGPYPNPVPMNTDGTTPIYFLTDSTYYLEIMDADGNVLHTVENYSPPTGSGGGGGGITVNSDVNYIVNPQFRFNYGAQSGTDIGTPDPLVIAQDNWEFFKDGTGSAEQISFPLFILGDSTPSGTPVQYLEVRNNVIGSNETYKWIQFFMPDVRSFEGQQVTMGLAGQSPTGSTIRLYMTQFFGTGMGASAAIDTPFGAGTLPTSGWQDVNLTNSMPSIVGKSLGPNHDDGVYFRIGLPLNTTYTVNVVNIALRLGFLNFTFPVDTYNLDVGLTMSAQIPPPDNGKTGQDIGKALKAKQFGLEWADVEPAGSIKIWGGLKTKIPTNWTYCDGSRFDREGNFPDGLPCQRLYDNTELQWGNGYDYLWSNVQSGQAILQVLNAAAKVVTTAANGTISPGFTYDLKIPGVGSAYGLKHVYYDQGNTFIGLLTDIDCEVYEPVNPADGIGTVTTYASSTAIAQGLYILNLPTSGGIPALNNKYFFFDAPTVSYYVWINYNSTGTDPAIPGNTGLEVDVATTDVLNDVLLKIVAKIRGSELTYVTCLAASVIPAGAYFTIEASGQKIAPWYFVDNVGTAPVVTDYIPIKISVSTSTDTAPMVATKTMTAINTKYLAVPDGRGGIPMGIPDGSGIDPGVTSRFSYTNPSNFGDNVGTYQYDQNRSHSHDITGTFTNAGGGTGTLFGATNTTPTEISGQPRVTPYNFGVYYCITH